MPIFALYALLFADAGMSDRDISLLFVVWSVVAIVCEIPSGAWADVLPRRWLLAAAAVLYAGCFASWVLVPTMWGFAAGFALWGLSGALSSGTFQAFAYDELVAAGARHAYGRVIAWGTSLALLAVTLATATATPLFAAGGFALVGWVSVAVCGTQLLLVLSLPETPRVITVDDLDVVEEDGDPGPAGGPDVPVPSAGGVFGRWWWTLRTGVAVAHRDRVLRGGVLASAVLMGLLAFDEYFGLLLRDQGVSLVHIPVLLTLVSAAQAAGAVLADRAQALTGRTAMLLLIGAGAVLAAGALVRHPAGVGGVALGYGVVTMLIVVAEIRLQHVAPTPVRATVTSVSNILAETLAVGVYAAFALGAGLGISLLIGLLAAGVMLLGPFVGRWLPPAPQAAR